MNKRASIGGFAISMGIRIIFLAFFLAIALAAGASMTVESGGVKELDYHLYFGRVLYSPASIFYVDPDTARVHREIVDIRRFDEDTLRALLHVTGDQHVGLRLELTGHDSIYLDKQFFDYVLIRSQKSGQAKLITASFPVSTYDGASFTPGMYLNITEGYLLS
ncbi:TPA: hypothetical protein HA361_02675 [Candidatus Woesearchaeota archaeon]|nr:hypothetical protein [Candidatus Woesearchaeota archaeon]HII69461.1 hypothetical protein [Candidatus Woesearchaeota archaeon]